MKTYARGTYQKCLDEALYLSEVLLMSTNNICFPGKIKKILCEYLLLSGAMVFQRIISVITLIFGLMYLSKNLNKSVLLTADLSQILAG